MTLLDRFLLEGKTAIVTGASSGIGERIALVFAEAGASVYAVARRFERLSELAKNEPRIQPWQADLSREDDCEYLVANILERTPRIDVLVNNAGISNVTPAQDETTADFRRVVDLNLTATFILCREAGKAMIGQKGGGAIVNVASVVGVVGSGSLPQAGYAASKAGCINLTRELAFQWARHDIRVNALAPGWVNTEMTAEWLATDKGRQSVVRTTPFRRAATVDEVAYVALFLASEASSYVTGAVLAVDGGWTAV
ncbi:MAG: SDR family NAD(P)-dependent oxidoreductase [Acidimicrobiales bacterium]